MAQSYTYIKNDSIFATEKLRQEADRYGRPEGFGIDLAEG